MSLLRRRKHKPEPDRPPIEYDQSVEIRRRLDGLMARLDTAVIALEGRKNGRQERA